jgi:endonuclease/exonuclease/phosphatase (EEP) superfamily protein YafD
VALITIAGFGSGWLDYAAHFRPHLAVTAFLGAIGALLLLDTQPGLLLAAVFVAMAIVNVTVILVESRFRAPRASMADGATLKIASLNVNFLNTQHGRVDRWIRDEQPDILVVTEIGRSWVDAIDGLADLYPHRAIGLTNFVTMLSRRPWASLEVVAGPRTTQGLLVARFDVDGAALTVIGAHPASPVNPRWIANRDAELDIIARLAATVAGPVAAMGDFNATPWSAPMRRLVRASPLRYADLRATTWPTSIPRWLGIKIDHIMLGRGCNLVAYKVGPDVGSDHRPVVAAIRCTPAGPLP